MKPYDQYYQRRETPSPLAIGLYATSDHRNIAWIIGEKWIVKYQISQSSVSKDECHARKLFAEYAKQIAQYRPTAKWLMLIHKAAKPIGSKDISSLIKSIHEEIRLNGIESIGHDLDKIDLKFASVEMILGFIRGTCIWENSIQNWKPFARKAKNELANRQLDAEQLFYGIEC